MNIIRDVDRNRTSAHRISVLGKLPTRAKVKYDLDKAGYKRKKRKKKSIRPSPSSRL